MLLVGGFEARGAIINAIVEGLVPGEPTGTFAAVATPHRSKDLMEEACCFSSRRVYPRRDVGRIVAICYRCRGSVGDRLRPGMVWGPSSFLVHPVRVLFLLDTG